MRPSNTSLANNGQDLSAEEQFFTLLPLARLMIERGITPDPELGLAEFDATALLFAHSAGRLTLRPAILRAVIHISRGERYWPNRTIRREIAALARELLSRSEAILRAMEFQAPGEGGGGGAMTGAVIAPSRQLAVCLFADQKTTTPIKRERPTWESIIKLHAYRDSRPHKSGTMLGGYRINGARSNDNVPFRSLIQLDIDTDGVKDKATDRILEVTRVAPTLDEIRSGIDKYEWCAVSSHWHEPQRGIIKYRLLMLPDRDIQPEEYQPLLEAIDERLHGALDRSAWQWSQAFYLPSCPEENADDAFFEHNKGIPLPVDDFVRRGREIIDGRNRKNLVAELGNNVQPFTPMPETPENIERVKSMLSAIDPDVLRTEWRQICWGVMATAWACAPQLIREWSEQGTKFKETDFANVVRDFDPNAGTSFGTLVYIARQHGWEPSRIENGQADANGGAGYIVGDRVTIDHFRAYMPLHSYIFMPTREMWPASSIDARFPPIKIGT